MRSYARFALYALVSSPFVVMAAQGCSNTGDTPTGSSTGASHAGGSGNTAGSGAGNGGSGGNGGTASTGTSTGGVSTSSGTGGTGAHVPVPCQNHFYQCGDGIDNDGDGHIDSDDPDCLGPCDNTEGSYYGGIPGQTGPKCDVDCYFDQDSGSGNDDCYWNHKCDPHEAAPNYYPESWNGAACAYDVNANISGTAKTCDQLYQAQSQTCLDFCGPLTPNGCDCFGCCELPAGSKKYVWLGSEDGNGNGSCALADVADPTKCQPCLPVNACLNGCDTCELCIGKTTLPPECFPDGGTSSSSTSSGSGSSSASGSSSSSGGQCSQGITPCGLPGQLPCPQGYYCITGCCQKIPG